MDAKEMKEVWIVEDGEYSDYRVEGIFSLEENAQMYADAYGGDVVSRELDPEIPHLREGYKWFEVWMNKDGQVNNSRPSRINEEDEIQLIWPNGSSLDGLFVRVRALSEKHAIKIANERRSQLIATGRWEREEKRNPTVHRVYLDEVVKDKDE